MTGAGRVAAPGQSLQSLGRALSVLERVADSGAPLGLTDLAAGCGLPLSTAHRMVRALVGAGYLHQDPDRRYRLGPRLVALGALALHPVGTTLTPWLERLERATGETASAATLCGDAVLYVAQVQSSHAMRTSTAPHHRTMAHCSAVGKAMLSLLPDKEVVALVRRTGLPRRTNHTLGTVEELLDAVRTGSAWCPRRRPGSGPDVTSEFGVEPVDPPRIRW